MSLSRVARNCEFCTVGKGIYSCPKCGKKYCSSYCYKSREHESCSETFYREWVEQSLQEKNCDPSDREEMLRILQKFEDEFGEEPADEPDIEERFAGLDVNDVDVIWGKLNDQEKAEFKSMCEDSNLLGTVLDVKQPWWTESSLNLVSELDASDATESDITVPRPPYPINIKKLSDLTTVKPSISLQFNLLNILFSYAFLCRFHNCDTRDLLEDVVDYLLAFTPVLSSGKNYSSLEEALQDSIRLIDSSELEVPLPFVKSIVEDVNLILQGPKNAKSSMFAMCALHDIKLLFTERLDAVRNSSDKLEKQLKKQLFLSVKKIEYYMSWCIEFESTLKDISSDLVLIMLPDMVSNSALYEENSDPKKDKPLIEEVE